jgi:hypothetical protein
MMGITKILIPQERVEVGLLGGMSLSPGAHSPSGLFPQGQERAETNTRILRK